MKRPVIGITADMEEAGEKAKLPTYFLRQNYADAIAKAGGVPLMLPHEPELAEDYVSRIDALVVTGGAFDIDPAMFGATTRHATVVTKDRRTRFETAVTKGALARDIPVLGICGGQQLLNVILGGTLYQHIPDEVKNPLAHEQPGPRDKPGHDVTIAEGTLLHRITGAATLSVNSAHHQAAKILESPALTPYSGCHCTPRTKRLPGASIPSMTPSGASASTTTPGPTVFAAW